MIRIVGADLILVGPGHSGLGIGNRSVGGLFVRCLLAGFLVSLGSLCLCSFPSGQHLLLELVGEGRGHFFRKSLGRGVLLVVVGYLGAGH